MHHAASRQDEGVRAAGILNSQGDIGAQFFLQSVTQVAAGQELTVLACEG